jgi:hypothetical protein
MNWQPIETAPDGTLILCHWDAYGVDEIDVAIRCYGYSAAAGRVTFWWEATDGTRISDPLNWMPLPLPPSKEAK